jgi:hypothetical protein
MKRQRCVICKVSGIVGSRCDDCRRSQELVRRAGRKRYSGHLQPDGQEERIARYRLLAELELPLFGETHD